MIEGLIRLFQQLVIIFQVTFKQFSCVKTADPDSDCNGDWGGSALEDECGTCDNDSSNDCVQDCSGTWGGSAISDQCGVCDGDGSSCCSDFALEPDSFNISSGGEVLYYVSSSLSGFQFDILPEN